MIAARPQPAPDACDAVRLQAVLDTAEDTPETAAFARHLEQCLACQARLERLAAGPAWWRDAQTNLAAEPVGGASLPERLRDYLAPADRPDALGLLGRYVVTDVVGRGGAGIVLKALDPALDRIVAIKLLALEFAGHGAARTRFAREAKAMAAIAHDHVVPVYAVEPDAPVPYLVMAFVPGMTLQDRLDREGPLPLRDLLRIGMQTAAGLAAAHEQGLVHRDVKPANILLENGLERVRLTDFGLARAIDDASLTRSGVIAGTPPYMSPEQARGDAVDARSDLFSLGSVLYAAATGRVPFRAEHAVAVLRRVCDDVPAPIRRINPDIPGWLAALIGQLHEKDAAKRPATAAEVSRLLAACLQHVEQPEQAKLPTGLRTARPWLGPALTAVAGAVVAAAAIAFWPKPEPAAQPRRPIVPAAFPVAAAVPELDARELGAAGQAAAALERPATPMADNLQQELDAAQAAAAKLELSLQQSWTTRPAGGKTSKERKMP